MLYDSIRSGTLDYSFYRYGRSKVQFRGPRPNLKKPYFAFLGSTETFGKFVPRPFPDILQERLGTVCANFSALNAGVEMYLKDPSILLMAAGAKATVIGVCGAHNLSNRFYMVHPRHNDRFLRPSKILRALYEGLDFSEIHYTRHLLATLFEADPTKFSKLVDELKSAWVARMKTLLEAAEGRTVLLWMSNNPPAGPQEAVGASLSAINDPLLVDQEMMDELSPLATHVVECVASPADLANSCAGMVFEEADAPAAAQMPGQAFHREVADRLEALLKKFV